MILLRRQESLDGRIVPLLDLQMLFLCRSLIVGLYICPARRGLFHLSGTVLADSCSHYQNQCPILPAM